MRRTVQIKPTPLAFRAASHHQRCCIGLIVLAGARARIGRLGVPIALEKETEAVVTPVVAARNGDIDRRPALHALGLVSRNGDVDRRPAHQEAALGLVVEHRDELGAVVGLAGSATRPRR